jgi:hypothetical protein
MIGLVAGADIEWPPQFLQLMNILQFFSFNFDFVKPECSAKMEYWKK